MHEPPRSIGRPSPRHPPAEGDNGPAGREEGHGSRQPGREQRQPYALEHEDYSGGGPMRPPAEEVPSRRRGAAKSKPGR